MKYLASVDVMALIESLPKDQRTNFLQSLACQDEVIAHVVDQRLVELADRLRLVEERLTEERQKHWELWRQTMVAGLASRATP